MNFVTDAAPFSSIFFIFYNILAKEVSSRSFWDFTMQDKSVKEAS